jgi:hypothetical protein
MTRQQLERELEPQFVYTYEYEGLTEDCERDLQRVLIELEVQDRLVITGQSAGPAWGASLTFTGRDQRETQNAAITAALWIQRHHGKIMP